MRANLSLVYQEQAERFFDSQVDSYAIMQLDSSKVTPFERETRFHCGNPH